MKLQFQKGFHPTLFDCIDIALTTVLGKEAVSTFYYAISEKSKIPLFEFERNPTEILRHLEEILGVEAFKGLEKCIISNIQVVFQIQASDHVGLDKMIELAKESYLNAEL